MTDATDPTHALPPTDTTELVAGAPGPVVRRRSTWWIPVLGVAIAVLGAAGTHLLAGSVADSVRNEHIAKVAAIEEQASAARGDLRAAITRAGSAGEQGQAMAAVVVSGVGGAELATELDELSERALELAETDVPEGAAPIAYDQGTLRPAWISVIELLETRDRGVLLLGELEDLAATADEVDASAVSADAARTSFYASAATSGSELLAANQVATYETRIAVQHGIDQEGDDWFEAPDSAGAYTRLATAVEAMRASAGSESARRADAAYAEHGPVEEFARSIARGVNLDFSWAHVVNDRSSDEWYAGNATYRYTDGGWASIQLSHSIGWEFDADVNAKAVVVHEVGHTQVVRPECAPIFTGPVFGRDDEMWATAWAIAAGYDVPGSGIEAYGRPSDAQIAEAAKCL
ncbi:hypothetical protein [Agromyces salentinus]|uniref:Uncharacterized protein n=1 Tax=Agromyces salentinus TaxID=269421 RepID=A0ABN2MJD2_9MICO|nr:hypothetical protein [Agromyces salentinus]